MVQSAKVMELPNRRHNISTLSEAFSHVEDDKLVVGDENSMYLSGYKVIGIERGTIERARDLNAWGKTRHCFNEESIISILEATGQKFNIVKVVSVGLTSDNPEEPGDIERNSCKEQLAKYILVP